MRFRARAFQLTCLPLLILQIAAADPADPPIVEAARGNDPEEVRELLTAGSDVNAVSADGSTALLWVSYWDDIQTAEVLIAAGADVNKANDLGTTALWAAALNGSSEMTRRLLAGGANPNARLKDGESILMTASRSGNPDVVEQLVREGADPNLSATRSQTALMWAAAQGHAEVAEILVQNGADIEARTDSWSQLMATLPHSHPRNRKYVPHGAYTALLFAARSGDVETVRVLLERGANIEAEDAWGITPVTLAAHAGHLPVVQLLLDRGADPNAAAAGFAALHAAIMQRDAVMVTALLDHGADPNLPLRTWTPERRHSADHQFHPALVGATPFWLAARFGETDLMRLLVSHGADVDVVHEADYIRQGGGFDVVEVKDDITPLMAAAGMGGGRPFVELSDAEQEAHALEAVRYLVEELNADVTVKNTSGKTALAAAESARLDSVVEYLSTRMGVVADQLPTILPVLSEQ